MTTPAHRPALGRTGETFWFRSFDSPALLREPVTPWRSGPGSSYRVAVHDPVPRMAVRDGGPRDVDHPDRARYVEGQRIYLATCDPGGRADVIVDSTDLARPRTA